MTNQPDTLPDTSAVSMTDFSAVTLPFDMGQSELQVFVSQTGHSIRGFMLDFWRGTGAAAIYGNPISEPFASPRGYYSQAFENAIFEYRPEFDWTDDPVMRTAPIAQQFGGGGGSVLARDRRRIGGGGDRRISIWMPLAATSDAVKRAEAEGGFFRESTGHTVLADFAEWYATNEGEFLLGDPLSQAYREAGVTLQHFENGTLRRRAGTVELAPVGRQAALTMGVDLTPIDQEDLPEFDESLFVKNTNPAPTGETSTTGKKWIEVNISQERLWAFQGTTPVMTTLVSTGLAPNNTERGTFHIRSKVAKQTMSGFASATGEVVSLGDTPVAGGEKWEVKDVPHVMYVNTDAEALHGAYWHNNFGRPMSHGCINLPLDVAAWMFQWTPVGTKVWVHD